MWSAAIHYHLWDDGYRSIATIGPLFLLQSIAGLVIGLGLVVVRRLWAALVGIGFALATLGGFLISVVHGLFGFEETWLAPFAQQASRWRSRRRWCSGSPPSSASTPAAARPTTSEPDRSAQAGEEVVLGYRHTRRVGHADEALGAHDR